ncbi:hypothetical protein D3C87_1943040 [compost metagenome]
MLQLSQRCRRIVSFDFEDRDVLARKGGFAGHLKALCPDETRHSKHIWQVLVCVPLVEIDLTSGHWIANHQKVIAVHWRLLQKGKTNLSRSMTRGRM